MFEYKCDVTNDIEEEKLGIESVRYFDKNYF